MLRLLGSLVLFLRFGGLSATATRSSSSANKAAVRLDVLGSRISIDDDAAMPSYGVDVSFPMHHANVSNNYAWLPHNVKVDEEIPAVYQGMPINPLGNRQAAYEHHVQGCISHWGNQSAACLATEKERIAMSLRQPQSMKNYTKEGFQKIRAPAELFSLLAEFWETNLHKAKPEVWGKANTYTNNWESPTDVVSVENSRLVGGGMRLKAKIWKAAETAISEWTGQSLRQTSLYGIRVYKTGSILATHVDRLPLVSSAIINVAQDLDEPWPLEVIGHDGMAANVTMEPGDMVLYESHSILHGRPFPLQGKFMANVFIHFEPIGPLLKDSSASSSFPEQSGQVAASTRGSAVRVQTSNTNRRGNERVPGGNDNLPVYVLPGSPVAREWDRTKRLHYASSNDDVFRTSEKLDLLGSTNLAHVAASTGDVPLLKATLRNDHAAVHARDENGWTPLHEAARGGHLEAIKLLLRHGADANAVNREGRTAFECAKHQQQRGDDERHSAAVEFLQWITSSSGGANEL